MESLGTLKKMTHPYMPYTPRNPIRSEVPAFSPKTHLSDPSHPRAGEIPKPGRQLGASGAEPRGFAGLGQGAALRGSTATVGGRNHVPR